MMKFLSLTLASVLFLVFFLGTFGAKAQEELPFWRRKANLYKKIIDDRRIVVQVKKGEVKVDKLATETVDSGRNEIEPLKTNKGSGQNSFILNSFDHKSSKHSSSGHKSSVQTLSKEVGGQRDFRGREKKVNDNETSVQTEENFRVVGAGTVNSPLPEIFQDVQEFENLPKVSSYFKTIRHDKKNQLFYLRLEALGYVARMFMKYKVTLDLKNEKQLDFQVVKGTFKGMAGHYNFKKVSEKKTEVAMWSFFKSQKLPIPDVFLKFTLEVISKKVAQKMRTYLERVHKERLRKRNSSSSM